MSGALGSICLNLAKITKGESYEDYEGQSCIYSVDVQR